MNAAGAVTILNLTISTANVENSITLPLATKHFQIKTRGITANFKLAFIPGNSGTTYISIPKGCNYSENDLSLTTSSRVLYIQSDVSGVVLECIAWV